VPDARSQSDHDTDESDEDGPAEEHEAVPLPPLPPPPPPVTVHFLLFARADHTAADASLPPFCMRYRDGKPLGRNVEEDLLGLLGDGVRRRMVALWRVHVAAAGRKGAIKSAAAATLGMQACCG
jgi:hypothetical protein